MIVQSAHFVASAHMRREDDGGVGRPSLCSRGKSSARDDKLIALRLNDFHHLAVDLTSHNEIEGLEVWDPARGRDRQDNVCSADCSGCLRGSVCHDVVWCVGMVIGKVSHAALPRSPGLDSVHV